jgi:geranylgeranyl pyrophosphate synthase
MATALQQEVADVRAILEGITHTLHPALSEFVQDEIGRRQTLHLAPVVLAAALPAEDGAELRERRVQLAAALELLTVALDIHKLLILGTMGRDSIDRALAGGTVLAGDYCFSRAASLAARTENPAVVAIFSDLLQQLSEGNLRRLFPEGEPAFDEAGLLYHSGALAGATLAGLPSATVQATAQFGPVAHKAPPHMNGHHDGKSLQQALVEAGIAPFQQERWQEILNHRMSSE